MSQAQTFKIPRLSVLKNAVLQSFGLSSMFSGAHFCEINIESLDGGDTLLLQKNEDLYTLNVKPSESDYCFEAECLMDSQQFAVYPAVSGKFSPEILLEPWFIRFVDAVTTGRIKFAAFDSSPLTDFEVRMEERICARNQLLRTPVF